jgi:transcriptional regulator with XRE-family HTH domain
MAVTPKGAFGSLLKRKREELSLTQRALAGRLGLSPAYVASLEWGERKPSLVVLHRVAQTLHLDAPKLFVLSYPAEARIFQSSRNSGRTEVSAWQRLAANRALRAKERISPAELKVLKEVSRLGRVSSERQLLFVLRSIRLLFEDDRRL